MRDTYLSRIVLMIFLLPAATCSIAQSTPVDFLAPYKTWTEGYNWCSFEGDCNSWSFRYKFDTLPVDIGAQTYFRLLKAGTEFSEVWTDEGSLIREVDGRIYLYQSSGEQLIYDFNLIEGDTFHYLETPSYYNFVVETVDTFTLLDGQFRKHWALRPITWHDPVQEELWIHWIEGIGNKDGLLTNGLPWTADAEWSTVLCVQWMDTLIYDNPDYATCWLMSTSTIEESNTDIKAIPNPARETISFTNLNEVPEQIQIFDCSGHLVYKGVESQIDLDKYTAGFYTAMILLKNGKLLRYPFVKL